MNYSNNDGSETYNRFLYQPGKTPSIPFVQDESDIQFSKEEKKKISKTIIALNNTSGNQMFVLSSNDIKLFGTSSEPDIFPGNVNDLDIIDKFIGIWKNKVPNYDLKLCEPSYFPSVTNLNFKSPVGTQSSGTPSNDNQAIVKNTPDEVKFKLSIIYDTNIPIKAGQDMPDVNIYVGDPPKEGEFLFDEDEFDDLYLLDDEFREVEFDGESEAPSNIADPPPSSNTNEGGATTGSYIPVIVSGGGVVLPKGNSAYSHNTEQGYNLVDSKWYGDILTSALAHIDHPTFDIPGTESGNLGCASWVSMVFYRAFGVHMKDGKPVKKIPKSIGDFGSTGTGQLGGWFALNPQMWIRIPWEDGQPGDVINTERGTSAGHVGVVMNTKDADGSWKVASNSSKGFGSPKDPRGCGKLNYSIKKWKSVTSRNPTKTFCWRYKGPKLSPGQNA